MNERIKQLALQAGEYVNEVYTPPVRSKTPGKIWEDGHIGWHTQFNQKFAELIVQECVNRVTTKANGWGDMTGFAIKESILDCAKDLKKHFGVEE